MLVESVEVCIENSANIASAHPDLLVVHKIDV